MLCGDDAIRSRNRGHAGFHNDVTTGRAYAGALLAHLLDCLLGFMRPLSR
jgi:hypothetical protein